MPIDWKHVVDYSSPLSVWRRTDDSRKIALNPPRTSWQEQKVRVLKVKLTFCAINILFLRKKVKVVEMFVHENYTAIGSKANDIALLLLGSKHFKLLTVTTLMLYPEERVDLSKFTPVCLPSDTISLTGNKGHIYGEESLFLKSRTQ